MSSQPKPTDAQTLVDLYGPCSAWKSLGTFHPASEVFGVGFVCVCLRSSLKCSELFHTTNTHSAQRRITKIRLKKKCVCVCSGYCCPHSVRAQPSHTISIVRTDSAQQRCIDAERKHAHEHAHEHALEHNPSQPQMNTYARTLTLISSPVVA